MQVEFTNQARSDLVSIGLFIAGDNPTRAKSFVMELRSACRTLAESADRFVVVSINDGGAIYRMPHRAYSIFYQVRAERVLVLRIVHGAVVTGRFIDDLP